MMTSRPTEVFTWIQNKRKDQPPVVEDGKFGTEWIEWWSALQPKWRIAEGNSGGSFNREVPPDEDWRVLCKGGSSGIYTTIVALSWWIKASKETDSTDTVLQMAEDVQWVLEQMCNMVAKKNIKKRVRETEDNTNDADKAKRYFLTLLISQPVLT